jgi:hypothetical protein|tara:strand:+ start:51 stop:257 length:207 start_codon:yes stop_codon:yes gene_type:complete
VVEIGCKQLLEFRKIVIKIMAKGLPAMSFHASARFPDDIIVSTGREFLNSKISVVWLFTKQTKGNIML